MTLATMSATVMTGKRRGGFASESAIDGIRARSTASRFQPMRSEEERMLDAVRRLASSGSGVAELTRHQAEQIIKDLVKAGDVRRQQASVAARELYDRSRENRKQLV